MDIIQSRFEKNKKKLVIDREILVKELGLFNSKRKLEFENFLREYENFEKNLHFI